MFWWYHHFRKHSNGCERWRKTCWPIRPRDLFWDHRNNAMDLDSMPAQNDQPSPICSIFWNIYLLIYHKTNPFIYSINIPYIHSIWVMIHHGSSLTVIPTLILRLKSKTTFKDLRSRWTMVGVWLCKYLGFLERDKSWQNSNRTWNEMI